MCYSENNLFFGFPQKQKFPRGKGLGGSSQINYLLHFDGIDRDYDAWESLGAIGWGSKSMGKYLNKIQYDIRPNDNALAECLNESMLMENLKMLDDVSGDPNLCILPGPINVVF